MRPLIAATFALLAVAPAAGRAEDPPPVAAKPAGSWSDKVFGDLAVSRDGAWLAGRATGSFQLFPAAGGPAVTLAFPKDERPGFHCQFTPDSKWLVVPGEASSIETQGIPKDRTQAVYFFSVAAPSKRKAIQITLKAEGLDKAVKKYMDPKYKNMKTLRGAVMDLAPFAGSRMLLDRGEVGVEVWDAATATKSAAPPEIDGRWSCGISADGSRFVHSADGAALEVRDVKTNRPIATIRTSEDPKGQVELVSHPRLAGGDAYVVAASAPIGKRGEDTGVPHVLRCWSVADGKKLWETPLGEAKYVRQLEVTDGFVAVVLGDSLHLVDLSDGSLPAHALQGCTASAATPSADGKALWIADPDGVHRVELPEAKAK